MPDPYYDPKDWTPPEGIEVEEIPPIYRPNDTTTFRGGPLSDVPLLDFDTVQEMVNMGGEAVIWTQPAPRSCGVCGAKDNHNGVPHSEVEEERRRSRGGDI